MDNLLVYDCDKNEIKRALKLKGSKFPTFN